MTNSKEVLDLKLYYLNTNRIVRTHGYKHFRCDKQTTMIIKDASILHLSIWFNI